MPIQDFNTFLKGVRQEEGRPRLKAFQREEEPQKQEEPQTFFERAGAAVEGVPSIAKAGVEKAGAGIADIKGAFGKEGILKEEGVEDLGIDRSLQNRAAQFFRGVSRLGTGAVTTAFGVTPVGAGLGGVIGAFEPEVQQAVEGVLNTEAGKTALEGFQSLSPAQQEGIVNIVEAIPFAGKGGAKTVAKGLEQTGRAVKGVAKGAGKVGKGTTQFVVSKTTGLQPETLKTIVKETTGFEKAAKAGVEKTKGDLLTKVRKSITERSDELAGTGKEFQAIREGKHVVDLPEGGFEKIITDKGVLVSPEGKLTTTLESIPMSKADLNSLQEFFDLIKGKTKLTGNEVLNARKRLDNLGIFAEGKTPQSKLLAKQLRVFVDKQAKGQIEGLADLDKKFSSEITFLNKVKKDLFDRQGNIKDNALSTVANLTGKGKEFKLERFEKLLPGVTKEIKALKALEDVEFVKGRSVGNYAQGGLFALGFGTGNIPALVTSIISQPTIAIPILKTFGKTLKGSEDIIAKIIEKINAGLKLTSKESKLVSEAFKSKGSK